MADDSGPRTGLGIRSEWPRRRGGVWSLPWILALSAAAALCLVVAVLVALSGDLAGAVLPAYGVAFWGILAAYAARMRRQLRGSRSGAQPPALVQGPDGHPGVGFDYSSATRTLAIGTILVASIGALGIAASWALVGDAAHLMMAIVLIACAMYFLRICVVLMAPGRRHLVLTEHHLHHRSAALSHTIPWSSVVDVRARYIDGFPAIVIRAMPGPDDRVRMVRGLPGVPEARLLPFMVIRSLWLAGDPVQVLHTVRYYPHHPERRTELGTEAAIDRIRSGAATAPSPDSGGPPP